MKLYLLSILTLLIVSLNYSYSQTSNEVNNFDKTNSNKIQLADFTPSFNGIKIEGKQYSKTEYSVDQDSTKIRNEIKKVYSRDQLTFFVEIQLKEYNTPIKLLIFNMLGNLVKEVYNGTAIKGVEYPFDASNLPNGLYLCILEGPNFRDAEKFTISR